MAGVSLAHLDLPLARPDEQLRVLQPDAGEIPFWQKLTESGLWPLQAHGLQVLQVNVGRPCNQTCHHCHVDAGPDRRESMGRDVASACIEAPRRTQISTLDITGGAPEMNPNFRYLVTEARALQRRVIDRSNLTILVANGYEDLPGFLAEHQVEIVASLPCYLAENADAQRGEGVFGRSIEALRRLNQLSNHLASPPVAALLAALYDDLTLGWCDLMTRKAKV